MRPALLRLLKRPSALSLLSELNADIDQLSISGRCEACRLCRKHGKQYSSCRYSSNSSKPPTSSSTFRYHDILSRQQDEAPHAVGPQRTITGQGWESFLPLDIDRLEYESDLSRNQHLFRRLLDDKRRCRDFRLIKELLRYRSRHYKDQGVIDTWKGLTSGYYEVELPVEGDIADFFWQTFVDVGLRDEQFLNDLTNYAESKWSTTGKRWGAFHQSIVGGFLAQGLPAQAVVWHRKLHRFHLQDPNDIVRLLDDAIACVPQQPPDPNFFSEEAKSVGFHLGLRAFADICRATPGHKIYDPVINTMLSGNHHVDALYMSGFLIQQGDLPSDATLIETLLQISVDEQAYFSKRTRIRIREVRKRLQALQAEYPSSGEKSEESPTPAEDQKQVPEQPHENAWVRERTFRDEFGARLFATKALNVETITSGLQMFGVQSIGPLSLKEMALRADGPKDILDKIQILRDAGVTIRDCAFSRILEKLAKDNKDIVLEDFLHSDQHPDVLEDVRLQEKFLCSYMVARDWRLYNMTKAILSDIAKDDLDNIQFRALMAARDWQTAASIADKMFLEGNMISTQSVSYMMNCFLTPRVNGRHPSYAVDRQVDEVFYAERIMKMAFKMQTKFNPKYWVELLTRLGKNRHDQWERIHSLCLWLAHHYGPKDSPVFYSLSRSSGAEQDWLLAQRRRSSRHIFNPRLQMALVSWGFKLDLWNWDDQTMPHGQNGRVLRWTRGLILLQDLEKMGIQLYPSFIRQACRERLQVLYGQDRYSDRKWNRTLRQNNPFKLSHVLGDIVKVWPSLLTEEEIKDIHTFIDRPLTAFQARQLANKEEYVLSEQWRRA